MTKTIVADSSPLIVLLKSDLEFILPALFDEIIVPEAVYQEILAGKPNDAAKQKLPQLSWTNRVTDKISNKIIEPMNLGKGEIAVLNLALTIPNSRVLLDDAVARRAAKELRISALGTGGLLIMAKRNELIASVAETLQKVQDVGLWLSDDIIELIKKKAGE